MTQRIRWPNNADWARLDSIALAKRIVELAMPILNAEAMTETERVQRGGRIIHAANLIENKLQAVGPHKLKQEDLAAALQSKD